MHEYEGSAQSASMFDSDKHSQQTLWGILRLSWTDRLSVVLQAEAEEKESGSLEVTRTAAEAAFLEHFSSDEVSRMVQNQVRSVLTWLATCIRHGCCWAHEIVGASPTVCKWYTLCCTFLKHQVCLPFEALFMPSCKGEWKYLGLLEEQSSAPCIFSSSYKHPPLKIL